MPFCDGYSQYITAKNLDFKRPKNKRGLPDPIKEFKVYKERPPLDRDEDDTVIRLTQLDPDSPYKEPILSPKKKQREAEEQEVKRNEMFDPENWELTIQRSPIKKSPPKASPARKRRNFKSSVSDNPPTSLDQKRPV